jgi:hypothetical protein
MSKVNVFVKNTKYFYLIKKVANLQLKTTKRDNSLRVASQPGLFLNNQKNTLLLSHSNHTTRMIRIRQPQLLWLYLQQRQQRLG